MKIGILTFTNTLNFGAVLQAFALQEKLLSLGNKPEIIQYTNKKIKEKESLSISSVLTPKKLFSILVMGRGIDSKNAKVKKYEENNLIFGKVLKSSNLSELNEYYDKFITGSDQVWNMSITHKDWCYFLDFVEDSNKKLSYAPSFGNSVFPEDCKPKATELLKDFTALSVREASGKKLINELTGMEAQVVVDPTLLLSKQDWEALINFVPKPRHYILVYFPHNKKMVFDFVKKLKASTNLPVVYLSISPRIQFGVHTIYDASPEEFLGWIQHADYVVTGSFHGTAFSLNFEKQFYYEPQSINGFEGRIENLVRMTGTEERSITNAELDLGNKIDYSSIRSLLEKFREESSNWLENALLM